MNELMQSLFMNSLLLLMIPFLSLSLFIISIDHLSLLSNIQKSISFYIISFYIILYYSHRLFMECPKGIQSIFIYYLPDLLFYEGYYFRDSRIDIINNDLFAISNINKYIQSLFLLDFIVLLGFIDSVLGLIDRVDKVLVFLRLI